MESDVQTRIAGRAGAKFSDPDRTVTGEPRALVALTRLETLWINTGTLCNITCRDCYIESSPSNDRLVYLTAAEVSAYLEEIAALGLATPEIGFTGGEPFLNPDILAMLADVLARGHRVLVLTNAMQPMQRPRFKQGLLKLREAYGDQLKIRVSLDHYTQRLHEAERGPKTWTKTLAGIDWLCAGGFNVAIAGRTCWAEPDAEARAGYASLAAGRAWPLDAANPSQVVLFPEMDGQHDVPEISTSCWSILGKSPADMMCASSRMIVKRKGADRPSVVPCTLLPYEPAFEMGNTLAQSLNVQGGMFEKGAVKLCHSHCAKFCVLGGGSCSA